MSCTDADGEQRVQVAPAFHYTYAYVQGKKVGMIKPNRFLAERLSSNPSLSSGMQTKQAPMLVPPRQWSSWDEGGYWYTREEVMRTRASYEQRAYLKEASESNKMDEVFRGLDILGETCWTINRKIFDTILNVWNSGEAIADIPPLASGMQYPMEPKAAKWDVKARINWIQECKQMSRLMQNAHSQRCDLNYKLEIARAVFFSSSKNLANDSSLGNGCISPIISTSEEERILFLLISITLEMICVAGCYSSTKANLLESVV
jgi:DNA-directed RNA polymerase, mitochondrial